MAGNINILIIDDEEIKSDLLKDSLEIAVMNYNKLHPDKELLTDFTKAGTVQEALLCLDKKPYQLVLLDYELKHPVIDGESLAKIIRKTEMNKSTYICGCSKIWCMEGSPDMGISYKNKNIIDDVINMDFNYLTRVGYGYVVRKLEKVIHELADAVF